MVFPVFPNHMTTAIKSLQLASFWILPQVNNVAAKRINFILDQTQWVACLFSGHVFCPNHPLTSGYKYQPLVEKTAFFKYK